MPRTKLDKINELSGMTPNPRKYPPKQQPTIEAIAELCKPTVYDLSAAIVPSIPVTIIPVKGQLKKLAGTPYWVDVDSGLLYLDEKILRAIKNN